MNKLLFFVAAFVAVSLPAYAKLYWLPDYQFFNMKEEGRKYSPNSNRTATCSDGGYYNGVLGNDYNCAGVIYAHRVCYACMPKPCPNGYSTSVRSPCTPKEGYTEKFLSSGTSGGKVCGQCTYSEKSCAEGYSTDYQLAADCGSGSWSLLTNGKSGEKICGKCEPKNCPAGYDHKITSCTGDGFIFTASGYHGAEKCGKCDLKDCPAGYDYTITTCNSGYNFVTNGYHGTQTCGKCMRALCDFSSIRNTSLFNGRANTKAMINEIGEEALAATACNQFYAPGVDKNDANFGQGQWYLPAIGEWMELFGIAYEITEAYGASGIIGDYRDKMNTALGTIGSQGFKDDWYWSSSAYNHNSSWRLRGFSSYRLIDDKYDSYHIRCFQYLEDKFDTTSAPKIGDVMYSDLSYGPADDYDGSKTAVGVINWVSENGKSAKIVNLKHLAFSTKGDIGNFNPASPYSGATEICQLTTAAQSNKDITGIDNYNADDFLAAFQKAKCF